MTNEQRAANFIYNAMLKAPDVDAETLEKWWATCDRPTNALLNAYQRLTYREKMVMGMRLGFDGIQDFVPTRTYPNLDIATTFEMTSAGSIRKLLRRVYRRMADAVMETAW